MALQVLLADDDARVRDTLGFLIDSFGHQVTAVADGLAAWTAYQTGGFDLVVTDWMMPEMDGLELVRRIRAEGRSRYTYVIVITALGGTDHWLAGMEAGADDFVTKPCTPPELQARLRVAERILSLQGEVRRLEGLLPICTYCKKIKDDAGGWVEIEQYIDARTDAHFTHGICPGCLVTVQAEMAAWQARQAEEREP